MIVTTFQTNEVYEQAAYKLAASANTFDLRCVVRVRDHLSTWGANVAYKPGVILDSLIQYPDEDVLYVDADAEIVCAPVIDWDKDHIQIAAYYEARPNGKLAPCGGTLWFKNSNLTRAALSEWAKLNAADSTSADDWIHFAAVLTQFPKSMVHHLPPAWLWHEKTMRPRFPTAKPVIVHYCVGSHDYAQY